MWMHENILKLNPITYNRMSPNIKTNEPGIVAHAFNSRTPKSEVADIYVFEASQGYTVRPCLKKKPLK